MGSYSNPGSSLKFNSLANVLVFTGTNAGAWVTTAAAAGVPAGAILLQVFAYPSTAAGQVGVRPTGIAAGQQLGVVGSPQNQQTTFIVEADAAGKFDAWDPAGGTNKYYVIGYWK